MFFAFVLVHINIHNACIFEIRHFSTVEGFKAASAEETVNPRNLFMTFATKKKKKNI